jgi:hypothetical protein
MGHEVEEPSEQNNSENTMTEVWCWQDSVNPGTYQQCCEGAQWFLNLLWYILQPRYLQTSHVTVIFRSR